jgi:hypothetical protein
MSSIVAVFDQQAAGYEQNVRDNWDSLEQWERDYYKEFASWANDRKAVKRVVESPERRGYRPRGWGDVSTGSRSMLRTVVLAYAVIVAGLFFFTVAFQGVALGLAVINIARGKWTHGLVQLLAAGATLAFFQSGYVVSAESFNALQDNLQRYL